jgi:BirA family biotin operon repressor/biotin-[acetyl-CoA-carboxylase] ligase
MHHFENNYEKYVESKDLSMLKADYEKRLININKVVKIIDPDTEYEATALGITKEGALVVRKDDGSEEVINAGEVSVRGLYGYV